VSDTRPLVVAALGGNALSPPDKPFDAAEMNASIAAAADALASIAGTHDLIVTHGNGPQIGYLSENAPKTPLDVLGAESEGWLGYAIELGLSNRLPGRTTLSVLTRVVVAADDPAFAHPSKPVGPVVSAAEAKALGDAQGWPFVPDRGGFRRVVPSPHPLEVIEAEEIGFLVRSGAIVVCVGGGGIPVVRDEKGLLHGIDAVIDKDIASALLALQLGADALLLLTDVPGVYADWPSRENLLRDTTTETLAPLALADGAMGPKVGAAIGFVSGGGRFAAIGALDQAAGLLAGDAGTILRS
jgi:carbamate kinase